MFQFWKLYQNISEIIQMLKRAKILPQLEGLSHIIHEKKEKKSSCDSYD